MVINNERNMLIRFAKCCNATPGDEIRGYVSRGRGITIHRKNCPNLSWIKDIEDRLIDVEWETFSSRAVKSFKVIARAGTEVFSEIEGSIKKFNGHLIEGRIDDRDFDTLTAYFTAEIDREEDFKKVLKNLRAVPTIINVQIKEVRDAEPG